MSDAIVVEDQSKEQSTEQGTINDSSWGRIVGALMAPVATFRSLAARPTFLIAFALVVLVQMASALLITERLDMNDYVPKYLAAHGTHLTEKQVQHVIAGEQRTGWMKVLVGNVVVRPLFVGALVMLLLTAFTVQGLHVGFKRSLAVTTHALLPRVLLALITIGIVLVRGKTTYENLIAGGFVGTNPTFYLHGGYSPWLHVLLQNLDIFTIWILVLFVIGFREAGKVSRTRAAVSVVGLWLLLVGAQVAYAYLA